MALRDVKLDWYKVLGHPPALQPFPTAARAGAAAAAAAAATAPSPPVPLLAGYTGHAYSFCDGSYQPASTTTATLAGCAAKCTSAGCWCFDHGSAAPEGNGTCRLTLNDTKIDASSNGLLAYVSAKAPHPPPPPAAVYVGTLGACPWLASEFDLSACNLHLGEESHCVVVRNGSIIAAGNGTRGAIYALYELADAVLGVDPWWRFTQHAPEYLGSVELPDTFASIVPPPAFKYRGVFTNDEDLLGYFRRDPAAKSVFDLRTWDSIYETLLRAKANMIIPGTTPNPDDPTMASLPDNSVNPFLPPRICSRPLVDLLHPPLDGVGPEDDAAYQ